MPIKGTISTTKELVDYNHDQLMKAELLCASELLNLQKTHKDCCQSIADLVNTVDNSISKHSVLEIIG